MVFEYPTNYLSSISTTLELTIKENEKFKDNNLTIFHSVKAPPISILQYLERIKKFGKCTEGHFVLSLIYIDRLLESNPSYSLTSLNIHRFIIASIVVAAKYSTDFFYRNTVYAKIGGIPVKELNALELEFLYLLKYNLYVQTEIFEMYHSKLSAFFTKRSVTQKSNSSATEDEIIKTHLISHEKKKGLFGDVPETKGTVLREAF